MRHDAVKIALRAKLHVCPKPDTPQSDAVVRLLKRVGCGAII